MPFPLSTMTDVRESHDVATHTTILPIRDVSCGIFEPPPCSAMWDSQPHSSVLRRVSIHRILAFTASSPARRPLATPTAQHTMPLTIPFPIAHQQGARTPLSLTHTYIQTHNNHQHQKHPHNVYSLFDTKEGLNPMCIVLGESDWVRLYSETTNITKSIPINNQQ